MLKQKRLAEGTRRHDSQLARELAELRFKQEPKKQEPNLQRWVYRYDDHLITSLSKTPGHIFTELSMGYDKAIPIPDAINNGNWKFKFTLSPLFATQSLKIKNAALELELLQQEPQKNEKELEIRIKQLEKNYSDLLKEQNE